MRASVVRRAIGIAALAVVAVLGAVGRPAAEVRVGTYGWNYKNVPTVAPFEGYEFVALSPRGILAPGVLDSLRAFGASPMILLQPFVAVSNGAILTGTDYPWDTAVAALAQEHNAILRAPDGSYVDQFPGDRWDAWILDYRDTAFVDEFAALIVQTFGGKAFGILWDYGCGDLSWENLSGVDPTIWPAWRRGFARLVARVRAGRGIGIHITQCDQWPGELASSFDGLHMEQAGMSLNPPVKVWANATRYPGRWNLIRQEDTYPQRRRLFAAIARLTDARFNQCDLRGDFGGGSEQNLRDFEHFGMDLGTSTNNWWARAPGVYQRMFSRGVVLANLSSAPYVYQLSKTVSYTIQPSDGLTIQTRDALGRFITRITDAGR
jgi:hypothetical protein